jgi:hypothetical protein
LASTTARSILSCKNGRYPGSEHSALMAHYEAFAIIAEAFAKLAMICVMLKRLIEPKPTCAT